MENNPLVAQFMGGDTSIARTLDQAKQEYRAEEVFPARDPGRASTAKAAVATGIGPTMRGRAVCRAAAAIGVPAPSQAVAFVLQSLIAPAGRPRKQKKAGWHHDDGSTRWEPTADGTPEMEQFMKKWTGVLGSSKWLSPDFVVQQALQEASFKEGDVFLELGCGDGRVMAMAARKYGVRCVGASVAALGAAVRGSLGRAG